MRLLIGFAFLTCTVAQSVHCAELTINCGQSIIANQQSPLQLRLTNNGDCRLLIQAFEQPNLGGQLLVDLTVYPDSSLEISDDVVAMSFLLSAQGAGLEAVLIANPLARNGATTAAYWSRRGNSLISANTGPVIIGNVASFDLVPDLHVIDETEALLRVSAEGQFGIPAALQVAAGTVGSLTGWSIGTNTADFGGPNALGFRTLDGQTRMTIQETGRLRIEGDASILTVKGNALNPAGSAAIIVRDKDEMEVLEVRQNGDIQFAGQLQRMDSSPYMQSGSTVGTGQVTFDSPFPAPPVVTATVVATQTTLNVVVDQVTATGFFGRVSDGASAWNWIAIMPTQ